MFLLYIFAFLIHGAFSAVICKNGEEISMQETRNPEDLIGNWTYVYHWDDKVPLPDEYFASAFIQDNCPDLYFEAVTPEFVKSEEPKCGNRKLPFNWAEAKLKLNAPSLDVEDGVFALRDNGDWWVSTDCDGETRVSIKKYGNYIAIASYDKDSKIVEADLFIRQSPVLEDYRCVAYKADVGKGLWGTQVCG